MKTTLTKLVFLSIVASQILVLTNCASVVRSLRNEGAQDDWPLEVTRAQLPPVEDVIVSSEPLNWKGDEFTGFTNAVQGMLRHRDFEGLDSIAAKVRKNKERFRPGGGWIIHSFYSITAMPEVGSEDAWRAHIKLLEDWKSARPKSIAARVSLAEAYVGYAWNIRGTGYADSIPKDVMPVFEARMKQAGDEFVEAYKLEEKCYGYFEGVLEFARGGGVARRDFERVFTEAVAYDPTYQYFYMEKAQYLMPRWHGRPGELEAFINNTVASMNDAEGSKLYYLILDVLHGYRQDNFRMFEWKGFSWNRTKKGFVQLEKDHGMTRQRLNDFTKMAESAADTQAQCNSFKRLQGKNDFEPNSWRNREEFERQKETALEFLCTVPRFENQAQ